ncbi:MAG: hypothetical protein KBH99_06855 [Syntrophobacteraceae bacterium]|nr:hypothetical protein [Syntrophobacteraceae bacterium]
MTSERKAQIHALHPDGVKKGLWRLDREACFGEIQHGGEPNYCIHKLTNLIIRRIGKSRRGPGMCFGAMEHAKLEWDRRRLSSYEDTRIIGSGDIDRPAGTRPKKKLPTLAS